jgi:hypothetical protein
MGQSAGRVAYTHRQREEFAGKAGRFSLTPEVAGGTSVIRFPELRQAV